MTRARETRWLDCELHGKSHVWLADEKLANGLVVTTCANCAVSRVVGGKLVSPQAR